MITIDETSIKKAKTEWIALQNKRYDSLLISLLLNAFKAIVISMGVTLFVLLTNSDYRYYLLKPITKIRKKNRKQR